MPVPAKMSDDEMLVYFVQTVFCPLDRETLRKNYPATWKKIDDIFPSLQSRLLLGEAESLVRWELKILVFHEAGEAENPHAGRENGLYPAIRDLAAQYLLRQLPEREILELDARFIIAFCGEDFVNHVVVQRAMKILGQSPIVAE